MITRDRISSVPRYFLGVISVHLWEIVAKIFVSLICMICILSMILDVICCIIADKWVDIDDIVLVGCGIVSIFILYIMYR